MGWHSRRFRHGVTPAHTVTRRTTHRVTGRVTPWHGYGARVMQRQKGQNWSRRDAVWCRATPYPKRRECQPTFWRKFWKRKFGDVSHLSKFIAGNGIDLISDNDLILAHLKKLEGFFFILFIYKMKNSIGYKIHSINAWIFNIFRLRFTNSWLISKKTKIWKLLSWKSFAQLAD